MPHCGLRCSSCDPPGQNAVPISASVGRVQILDAPASAAANFLASCSLWFAGTTI
jgi:hypothetical protein